MKILLLSCQDTNTSCIATFMFEHTVVWLAPAVDTVAWSMTNAMPYFSCRDEIIALDYYQCVSW